MPAIPIVAFALGCALIHAGRARAAVVTRVLGAAIVILAVICLIAVAFHLAPDGSAAMVDMDF